MEIIQQMREIPGVHGVHIMAFRQEELVGEILEEAGLLPWPWQRKLSPETKNRDDQAEAGEPAAQGER